MFFNQSTMVSSALMVSLCLLGGNRGLVAGQETNLGTCTIDEVGPDALTNALGKSIPRTCIDVPFEDEGTTQFAERCYYTYVPDSCADSQTKVPLVFDIHGRNQCPLRSTTYTSWLQKAEEECFVVVMPIASSDERFLGTCFNNPGFLQSPDFGTEGANNVTTIPCCCEDASGNGNLSFEEPNDPLFVKMAIDSVLESFETNQQGVSIDSSRIYMAGHSNGCVTALSTAQLYSGTIAAVCCHAGLLATPPAQDHEPVPIWLVHGEKDTVIPYGGASENRDPFGLLGVWSIPETKEYLLLQNGCLGEDISEVLEGSEIVGSVSKGTNCLQNVEIVTLFDAGHLPYNAPFSVPEYGGSPTSLDTTGLAWEFCSAHVKAIPTSPQTEYPTSIAKAGKKEKKMKSKKEKKEKDRSKLQKKE